MGHGHAEVEYSQITDNIFVGSNLCCTLKSHIETLMDEGIDAEIDLEAERQESPDQIETYLWLPVVDHAAPSQKQLKAGAAMIDHLVSEGRKVYIHCRLGHGRGPTLTAAYFISKGDSMDQAIARVKAKRPEIHIEEPQRKALEEFEG